ncbi:MAG: hypothetical protein ABI579_05515, partial [Candidatus Sumerlaeota bacterium]
VGTFPRTDILQASDPNDSFLKYAFRKITAEGGKIIDIEGTLIAAAFVGMISVLRRHPYSTTGVTANKTDSSIVLPNPEPRTPNPFLIIEFLSWSAIGLMLSICFTAKGGTVNYIFCLGEAGVALFAAEALCLLWCGRFVRGVSLRNTHPILMIIAATVTTYLVFSSPMRNIRLTLNQYQSELPEAAVAEIRNTITSYAKPGDEILAPPFYAYATRTNVTGELAENYIWNIKYMNENFDGQRGPAVLKMSEIATAIAAKQPKIILLDTGQTGRVPEIKNAISANYIPANPPEYQTRNVRLEVWIPKK